MIRLSRFDEKESNLASCHPSMDTEVAPVGRFRGREAFGAIL